MLPLEADSQAPADSLALDGSSADWRAGLKADWADYSRASPSVRDALRSPAAYRAAPQPEWPVSREALLLQRAVPQTQPPDAGSALHFSPAVVRDARPAPAAAGQRAPVAEAVFSSLQLAEPPQPQEAR